METQKRMQSTGTQQEVSLDQKIQSLEMQMERKFAAMGILVGNMATFLTMQQERIRALEEQVQTLSEPEHIPGTPERKLASDAQRDYLKRLAEQTKTKVNCDDPNLTSSEASRQIQRLLDLKHQQREQKQAKATEPPADAPQPEQKTHTAPERTAVRTVRQAQKTGGRVA